MVAGAVGGVDHREAAAGARNGIVERDRGSVGQAHALVVVAPGPDLADHHLRLRGAADRHRRVGGVAAWAARRQEALAVGAGYRTHQRGWGGRRRGRCRCGGTYCRRRGCGRWGSGRYLGRDRLGRDCGGRYHGGSVGRRHVVVAVLGEQPDHHAAEPEQRDDEQRHQHRDQARRALRLGRRRVVRRRGGRVRHRADEGRIGRRRLDGRRPRPGAALERVLRGAGELAGAYVPGLRVLRQGPGDDVIERGRHPGHHPARGRESRSGAP